jgi:hypothetical protein
MRAWTMSDSMIVLRLSATASACAREARDVVLGGGHRLVDRIARDAHALAMLGDQALDDGIR